MCATANPDTKAWLVESQRAIFHAVSTVSARKIQVIYTPGASATRGGVEMAVQSLYAQLVIAVATVCAGIKMEKRCATVSQCIMAKGANILMLNFHDQQATITLQTTLKYH